MDPAPTISQAFPLLWSPGSKLTLLPFLFSVARKKGVPNKKETHSRKWKGKNSPFACVHLHFVSSRENRAMYPVWGLELTGRGKVLTMKFPERADEEEQEKAPHSTRVCFPIFL